MIVYHLCEQAELVTALQDGLKRSQGRTYVFDDWQVVDRLLRAMAEDRGSASVFEEARVLLLEVDADTLVAAPVPPAQLPGIRPEEVAAIQAHSRYLETDLGPERVVGVRNAIGADLTATFDRKAPPRRNLLRFFAYARPHLPLVAFATLAGIVKFLVPLSFPWLLRVVIDDILLGKTVPEADKVGAVGTLVVILLVLNLIWMAATYARSIFTAMAGHRMIRDLRVALFGHLQRLSHQFFATHQTGAIVTRVVHDISQAQNFVGSALTNVWMDLVLMVVLLCILIPLDPALTLVAMALLPVFLLSIRLIGRRVRQSTSEVQQRMEVLSGGLQEKLGGIAVVKAFGHEGAEVRAFRSQSDKLYNKVLANIRWMAINEMMVGFVILSAPLLVVWYGAQRIVDGYLTIGELTQFLLYLGMFYAPLQRLADLGTVLASALASINRIFEYFDLQPQVQERSDAKKLPQAQGQISMRGVVFGYTPGLPIIDGIDLEIGAGETVAFIGPSGSGKTTLANLVPRFYDPQAGSILFDGVDLRDLRLDDLRRQIGIVGQDTILFSGTIRENLLLARPEATPEQIVKALEAANAWDFVQALPEGLWTEIGERGARLSGGQRQRLALARAFLKDPRVLILDEATSALDSKSERLIQDALARLLEGRTAIVIAHRLSTILDSDKIATLDRGRLVELGSHQELVEQGGLYAQLYHEQFRSQATEET